MENFGLLYYIFLFYSTKKLFSHILISVVEFKDKEFKIILKATPTY